MGFCPNSKNFPLALNFNDLLEGCIDKSNLGPNYDPEQRERIISEVSVIIREVIVEKGSCLGSQLGLDEGMVADVQRRFGIPHSAPSPRGDRFCGHTRVGELISRVDYQYGVNLDVRGVDKED